MAYQCNKHSGECVSCGDCKKSVPVCPECGWECEIYYKVDGKIIGCENCIDKVDAYEE